MTDISLTATKILYGERWFSEKDLLHLTTASLWARNAIQQTAGEEHLPAVSQVRTEVLRLLRGLG